MAIILGIDAAWTVKQPSGVALIDTDRPDAMCIAAAPSYDSFRALSRGEGIDWDARQHGGEVPVAELLAASKALVGKCVDIIAIDMPVSTMAITGRREADQAVSRQFGGRGCGTHSPSVERPGPLGAHLTTTCQSLGYPVATTNTQPGTLKHLIEVYPHPALLALLGCQRRVPYKMAKVRKYWPSKSPQERKALILEVLGGIADALAEQLGPLPFTIPPSDQAVPTRIVKAYEDTLDAVVSAWVGWLYLQKQAVPLGDTTGAVWCPDTVSRHRSF